MKKILFLFVALISANAYSGITEAKSAYSRQDFETAFKEYLALAQSGDPKMQNQVGNMYRVGRGVHKDIKQALEWYERAAQKGNSDAQYSVAQIYSVGEAVPKNKSLAFNWYLKSANQGNAEAQGAVAIMYGTGEGTPKDLHKAVEYLRKSSSQGNETAQFNMGSAYCKKDGYLPFHLEVCYALLQLSSVKESSGIAKAALDLHMKEMTREEIDLGKRLAIDMSKPGNLLTAMDAFVKMHPKSKK